MLLFIALAWKKQREILDFNTSHVTVYHITLQTAFGFKYHFNTSHVTVYLLRIPLQQQLVSFQYISCYCLSSATLASFTSSRHFNTSHVTVYLLTVRVISPLTIFQYISCYCLSWLNKSFNCVRRIFQYISCYCLSKQNQQDKEIERNFNTSHVTVYHLAMQIRKERGWFQYISCYCLSFSASKFINDTLISIHLMLLFIKLKFTCADGIGDFNTSHVTVYPVADDAP